MRRYDFTSDDVCHSGCRIEEFDDGEYVKWEDIKPLFTESGSRQLVSFIESLVEEYYLKKGKI